MRRRTAIAVRALCREAAPRTPPVGTSSVASERRSGHSRLIISLSGAAQESLHVDDVPWNISTKSSSS
jgi:hypothetical protein